MSGQRAMMCVLVATVGCDPGDLPQTVDEFDQVSARELESNGFRLNGFRLNGFRLNGFRLNGFRLNGDAGSADYIDLENFELLQGGTVVNAWLAGSELRVQTSTGTILAGAQLAGAVLHFGLVEGAAKKRKVKIAGVTAPAAGSEVWLYDLQIKDGTGVWEPLCLDSLGLATQAILVGEVWDPATGSRVAPPTSDVVTLACLDAAIGKCAEWGYYPWEFPTYHQACTRMVRADYCGDGVSRTVEGVLIHIVDDLGIEEPEPGFNYVVEAEWGPDGATCLDPLHTRLSTATVSCELPACGETFASGGTIQTGIAAL